MKIKILSGYNPPFRKIGEISEQSIEAYARAHSLAWKVDSQLHCDRPSPWAKIPLILAEIERRDADFLFWVDADACFCRLQPRIEDQIRKNGDLYLVRHRCTVGALRQQTGLFLQVDRPNTGVLLIKVSAWSHWFFQKVWEQEQFLSHRWYENAAVNHLLGYHYELTGGKQPNHWNEEILSHVRWMPDSWNKIVFPTHGRPSTPILWHFAGLKKEEKEKCMKQLARTGKAS